MVIKEALISKIVTSTYFKNKLATIEQGQKTSFSGLVGSAKLLIVAGLAQSRKNILLVTASTANATRWKNELAYFYSQQLSLFPALDNISGEKIRPSQELVGQRLAIVNAWLAGSQGLVLAPLQALSQKTARQGELLEIKEQQRLERDKLIERLITFGYKRFDIVGERGEFSVRGGVVDIFPINESQPYRLEYQGEEIVSLRTFAAYSQRSTKKVAACQILPAHEKAECWPLEILPPQMLVVADEPLELLRPEAGYDKIKERVDVELTQFLQPGEENIFSLPPDFINQLEKIPAAAQIYTRHLARLREARPELHVMEGAISRGLVFQELVLLSDYELFGAPPVTSQKEAPAKEGVADELLADLRPGDFVVHENYGVGVYRGIEVLDYEEVKQEYLLIEYAGSDKLFVPPAMAGLVEKYQAGREAPPRLSRLGTREWLQTRRRVKQAVREMTQELLQLYAARKKFSGIAFPPDDLWQKELEATFPYDETPDQLQAIDQVKKDMEAGRPMDRLVCGDVGYGKTEVAIRAAIKAAAAGKQVALLAPTTILVEQHYNNIKQRCHNLPFTVEMLSRFRSPREQKAVVAALAAGGIDLVIGTHRLLSKDIEFKDLGLMIIDEEQKFGVAHKEKLKQFRQTVDVLTLSATPIPRTLYFSLAGLREMSLISTPPVDRSPIKTHILPFSEVVIQEAIRRELDRGGQVYFLHNYVETIEGMAARLRRLVPEAKLAIAHGQLPERELEQVMLEFLDQKYDVLACTSIIESGLDITNVNTILIDQADRLGLAQLYQIRGRVGRSATRAYAYLFYHPARSLSDQAVERLKAIQEFTALGSGYKLARRDLEIRGTGNLLGAEQSGHIYEVGFTLYCELLEEAAQELRGEKVVPLREVEIDLKIEAAIPPEYVSDDRQRIALYRRMNLIATPEGISELGREFTDRFGPIPPPLEKLLAILRLKLTARERGIKSIKEKNRQIVIEWLDQRTVKLNLAGQDPLKSVANALRGAG